MDFENYNFPSVLFIYPGFTSEIHYQIVRGNPGGFEWNNVFLAGNRLSVNYKFDIQPEKGNFINKTGEKIKMDLFLPEP